MKLFYSFVWFILRVLSLSILMYIYKYEHSFKIVNCNLPANTRLTCSMSQTQVSKFTKKSVQNDFVLSSHLDLLLYVITYIMVLIKQSQTPQVATGFTARQHFKLTARFWTEKENGSLCGTWSVTIKEEPRWKKFENKVLGRIFSHRKEDVTGGWKILNLCKLWSLANITGAKRNAYTILVRKPEGKSTWGPKCRWEVNIKMDLREIVWIEFH
jgi:hypothetical protein